MDAFFASAKVVGYVYILALGSLESKATKSIATKSIFVLF